MPEQIKRLGLVIVIAIIAMVGLRSLFIPETFYEYGHYRGESLEDEAAYPARYAGHEACGDCHEAHREVINSSYHRNLNCEVCHGPGQEHIELGGDNKMPAPRERGYCLLCHSYLVSRPTGFPQVDPQLHNPGKLCFECHDAHDPRPPHSPTECRGCHRAIDSMKAVSLHAKLSCETCHRVDPKHKVDPRGNLPSKLMTQEVCVRCHAGPEGKAKGLPQIKSDTHGEMYLCWECHLPHYPQGE